MIAFCIFSGDSSKSFAIDGKDVFRIVESSICIKMAVARISGRTFFTVWRGEVVVGIYFLIGYVLAKPIYKK
jgi:hypothetical protein